MIFCLYFILSSRTSSRLRLFSEFFYLKASEERGGDIVVAGKVGRNLKSNVSGFSCLNFWDEAWWFLSLRVFGLLSSSLLLFPQRFSRYVLLPSSGVWSNWGTFMELRTTSFIESMGVVCSDSVSHNRVQVLSIPVLLLACSQDWTCNLQLIVSFEA